MDSNIIKFPFSVSRRAHARKPRTSDNGTPEERAAKFVPSKKSAYAGNPLRAKFVAVSRAATIAGRVNYQSRDLSRIGPLGKRHSQELRSAAKEARYLASEFERAAGQLAPSQRCGENHQSAEAAEDGSTLVEFLQKLRAYFVQEIARGKEVDRIFDDLEGSYKRLNKGARAQVRAFWGSIKPKITELGELGRAAERSNLPTRTEAEHSQADRQAI